MIGLLASLLLAAAAPDAAVGTAAPAEKPAAQQKAETEKICWNEAQTGTRFSHKVCATREQLDQRRRDDQDAKMRLRVNPPVGN